MRRLLDWFRDYEPAWLNSLKVAAFAILGVLGITLSTEVEAEVGFWLGIASVLLTQLQAILTRFGVFAPATVQAEVDAAASIARIEGDER